MAKVSELPETKVILEKINTAPNGVWYLDIYAMKGEQGEAFRALINFKYIVSWGYKDGLKGYKMTEKGLGLWKRLQ